MARPTTDLTTGLKANITRVNSNPRTWKITVKKKNETIFSKHFTNSLDTPIWGKGGVKMDSSLSLVEKLELIEDVVKTLEGLKILGWNSLRYNREEDECHWLIDGVYWKNDECYWKDGIYHQATFLLNSLATYDVSLWKGKFSFYKNPPLLYGVDDGECVSLQYIIDALKGKI